MIEAHISQGKRNEVEEIKRLFREYPVVGIVDMRDLPALQLQRIKKELRGVIIFKMSKRRLVKIAIEQLNDKKGIEKLKERITGMPALIFTKEDPFKMYKLLSQNKSAAAAKAGQVAPKDLVIPAGPTSFVAGPMISVFGQAGIKTMVEAGKISVKEDTVVVKKGESIKQNIADILVRFGIEPIEIGLNLRLIYNNGEIIEKDVLTLLDEDYHTKIIEASRDAFNLAIFISYISKETIEFLIKKASMEGNALAMNINFTADEISKVEEEKPIVKEVVIEVKEKIKEEDIKEAEKLVEEIKDKAIKQNIENEIDKDIKELEDKKVKKKFEQEEDKANEILKKLQDEKIKKGKT